MNKTAEEAKVAAYYHIIQLVRNELANHIEAKTGNSHERIFKKSEEEYPMTEWDYYFAKGLEDVDTSLCDIIWEISYEAGEE